MFFLVSFFGRLWKILPPQVRTLLSRSTHPTFTVSVAGIITNAGGRVLLLDHVLRPRSGWGLPGGFIDFGEQPDTALHRELREETGIEIHDLEIYRVRTVKKHVEVLFTGRSDGEPRVLSREITQLGWFAGDELPAEMSDDQKLLLRKVLRSDV